MPMILLHLVGEDPVLGEIEELPAPTATSLTLRSPRKRDGKDLHYLSPEAGIVFWPLERVNFIEVISGEEEEAIISFIRE